MSDERRQRGGLRSVTRVMGATALTLVVGTLAAVGSGWDSVVPGIRGAVGDAGPGAVPARVCGETTSTLPAHGEAPEAAGAKRVMVISTRAGVVRLEMAISGA